MKRVVSYYESLAAREQYLFFHYGSAREYLPFDGPADSLNYPSRALDLLVDARELPPDARGLDLGCAVGRTSFEMTRYCREVIGIDLSRSFIRAARRMQTDRKIPLRYTVEGSVKKHTVLRMPRNARRPLRDARGSSYLETSMKTMTALLCFFSLLSALPAAGAQELDVLPDPFEGGDEEFVFAYDLIEASCQGLLTHIEEHDLPAEAASN